MEFKKTSDHLNEVSQRLFGLNYREVVNKDDANKIFGIFISEREIREH